MRPLPSKIILHDLGSLCVWVRCTTHEHALSLDAFSGLSPCLFFYLLWPPKSTLRVIRENSTMNKKPIRSFSKNVVNKHWQYTTFYKHAPTYSKTYNLPHPAPKRHLSTVGPTMNLNSCPKCRMLVFLFFFYSFSLDFTTLIGHHNLDKLV